MSELLRRLGPARDVPPCGGPAWRRAARSAALTAKSLLDAARPQPPAASQILLLHHVRADEDAALRRLLSDLSRTYRLVDYPGFGDADEPTLSVSFDDGLACNLRAAGILEDFGVRGAFFVCPPVHDEADDAVLARFCQERLRHQPAEFLSWDEIELLHRRGHTIGGHTMSHVDLGRVPDAVALEEIEGCRAALVSRLGSCDHFAWPYGTFAHVTPTSVGAAFAAGFSTVASGVRGSHAAGGEAGEFPRTLRRQSIEANWPVRHVRHFLAAAARTPVAVPQESVALRRAA